MQVSSNDEKISQIAFQEALNSPCLMRHGCVCTMSGKVIARGFNHHRSVPSSIWPDNCTCHAEMAALRRVYSDFNCHRRNRRNQIKVV